MYDVQEIFYTVNPYTGLANFPYPSQQYPLVDT